MTLVFVYGTLKRGGENHVFLAGKKFVGVARTPPGFTLFSLGSYPGMVPWPSDRDGVTGEIWSVDAPCLARLDELEGLAESLYRRAPVTLLAPFDKMAVETYFYLRPVAGLPRNGSTWPLEKLT